MVLAALLTIPRNMVNTSRTELELVSNILRTIKHLPGTAIYHGKILIAMHGPWSWCPPSVFDMRRTRSVMIPSHAEGLGEGCELTVRDNGSIAGVFAVYRLQDSDLDELLPFGHHPSMEARIRNALLEFSAGCPTLTMQVEGQVWKRHIDLWLLAVPVHAPLGETPDPDSPFAEFKTTNEWKCRWIGCVYVGNTRKGEFYRDRVVVFGEDVDDQGSPASAVEPLPEVIEEARFIEQKVEKIKRDHGRKMIDAYESSRNIRLTAVEKKRSSKSNAETSY
ncbi:hypothetical protein F5Y09DRAFT_354011 [Xylaria sp. FL1042]|nr:hypothetical protein F5Y09DRAFT_354011 [Xylaria sp. FL1042]